jgi:hypothetical protein
MTLTQLLSIPFMRGAESVSDETGAWARRFEYPEIPGCVIEAQTALDGLRALELLRVARLLTTVAGGHEPPCPRPPLQSLDVAGQLKDFGLEIPLDLLALDEHEAVGDPRIGPLAEKAALMAHQLAEHPTAARTSTTTES